MKKEFSKQKQKGKKFFILPFILLLGVTSIQAAPTAIEGRWDIVINKDGKQLPSWLEVRHSGNHTLVGRFVYAFGIARLPSKF